MNRIVRQVIFILLAWLHTPIGVSQSLLGNHKTLTIADGIPNSTITGIVQDGVGFIWIATSDGLARYDGRQMKVFRHDKFPNSLTENTISSVQLLPAGVLLLQTHTGDFLQFDPITEQFTPFLPLAKQGKRKIDEGWVSSTTHSASGKLFWALWRGEKIQVFDQNFRLRYTWDDRTLGVATKTLHSITQASNGRVYAHHDEGLVELDAQTGKHRLLPFKGPITHWLNRVMPVVDWKPVAERPNGEIMVIGQHYLLLLNAQTGQYRELKMPGDLVRNGKYGMRVCADGKVYISMANRLYELLPDDRFLLVHEWEKPQSEQQSYGVPYLTDRSGVLWLHTQMGDIKRLNRQLQPFQASAYRTDWKSDILEVQLGVTPPSWKLSSGDSWTRFTNVNGRLWFIDITTLYQCKLNQHRFSLTATSSDLLEDNCSCKIAMKPDHRGHLWIYGNIEGGLTEMDSAGHIKRFWPHSLVPQTFINRGLDVADIQPMGNTIWMASYLGKGLFKYDLRQKKIVAQLLHNPTNKQSLPTNQLLCLAIDPYQPTVLWIGTMGEGLTRYDTKTGHFQVFTEQSGLPNNTIYSLIADSQKFLWIATNKGLVRMDTRSFQTRRFTQVDGLQDNEFGHTLAVQLPDNRLAFGGQTGITIFEPTALKENTVEPPVVLSGLRVNNEPVEVRQENSLLIRSLNALDQLTLGYRQNFLTFEFAALEYTKPEKIQYRYQLMGVDPDWVNSNGQHTANYTQLTPGDYIFKLNSTNTEGAWSHRMKQIAIHITPPIWATWWAYSAYFLVFAGLVLGFIRLRLRRLHEQQTMQLQQREAEQLKAVDELKTRFFSNITHEFRTPLSLILSPTEKLLQETKHDASTRQTLSSVHRNAGQLLQLVNQLLDLSKLEGGGMAISLSRGNVAKFIEQIVDTFRAAAEQKLITLTVRTENRERDYLFDSDKWLKISSNILINALKFTPAGGSVSIELTDGGQGTVCLVIADTGIGIRAEKVPHIFDRFYQVDDTHTRLYDGTGIGLALVKELIDVLGGTIAVASEPGKGTTFTIQLPVLPALIGDDVSALILPVSIQNQLSYLPERLVHIPANQPVNRQLVLVVEDNEELRSFIAGELAESYRVLTAANGVEGWELAQHEFPDVVISDVMMPEMDGNELTHLLKTNSVTNHIGIILLTARASHHSQMEGLLKGADDYLTKPFHVDELRQRLHNLLTRQQMLRDYYYKQFTHQNIGTPGVDFQPETVSDDFLRQLYAGIDDQLDNPAFGVDDLARKVGMSRRTLDRKLAAMANQSANNVIRHHRLKRAAQFLLEGRNVSETAYLVGYESPAHFSQIFKELFQKTPTEFAQRQE